jgi:hypothetical protein
LKRPVFARIATLTDWPMILIDLLTEEGIVGRSYLEGAVTANRACALACGSVAKGMKKISYKGYRFLPRASSKRSGSICDLP